MSYTEFPTDRIVDVHFKRKPEPPPNPYGPPYCGTYGYGGIVQQVGFVITSVNYGPNIFPPFVGTFSLIASNGPDGIYGGLNPAYPGSPTTMTASPWGLAAYSMFLFATDIQFSNGQLRPLTFPPGYPVGSFQWTVPMVQGGVLIDEAHPEFGYIPLVIDTYTIEWETVPSAGHWEFGIGISHPLTHPPGGSQLLTPPPVPQAPGNSGSYTYHFQWKEWILNEFIITPDNQYDATVGGPAALWWMQKNTFDPFAGWQEAGTFGNWTNGNIGDSYTWKISATCIPEPNIFGR